MVDRIIKKIRKKIILKNKTERFRITRGEKLKKLQKKNILKKKKKFLKKRLIVLFCKRLIIKITIENKTFSEFSINSKKVLSRNLTIIARLIKIQLIDLFTWANPYLPR